MRRRRTEWNFTFYRCRNGINDTDDDDERCPILNRTYARSYVCCALLDTHSHLRTKIKRKKNRCGKKSLRERKIQNLHAWNSQHVIFPATNDELFERIQFAENGKIKSDDDGVGVTVDIVVTNPRMMVLNLLRLFGGKRKTEGKRN